MPKVIVTMKVAGTQEIRRLLAKHEERGVQALGAALFEEGEKIMARSKREAPADTGRLRGSGFVRPPDIEGSKIEVTMGYGGAAAPYALYVHEGTGPAVGRPKYWPPFAVLERWTELNRGKLGIRLADVKQVARLIQRKVYHHGTEPTKFLERPFRAAKRGFNKRVARRMRVWLRTNPEGV